MLTPISAVDTCGRWLRSTDFQYVVDVRYAIFRVSRARRCFGYFAIFREMSRHCGWDARLGSRQPLTVFDIGGQKRPVFGCFPQKSGCFVTDRIHLDSDQFTSHLSQRH